ncbi:MAG: glycosyltransferase family 4 protein [Anaerolineae bacterium]|nr:glycosyltransferase family 4 protein [Anaerolineae bacterium]
MQMCAALAQQGAAVTLVVPRRANTLPLQRIRDPWQYYGVPHNFRIQRLPCLDFLWLASQSKLAFLVQTFTFSLALMLWLALRGYERLFCRDLLISALLSSVFPASKLIYEVHSKGRSARSQRLQGYVLRRAGLTVSLTEAMARQLREQGAQRVIVAHDGVEPARFKPNITQKITQDDPLVLETLEKTRDKFVICYAGRLQTMGMDKGLAEVVQAVAQAQVPELTFLLVGGPEAEVDKLRAQWQAAGLPPEHFVAVGSVPPTTVPAYLALADLCIIASPRNEFFANETSPMKLFEYMMAGKAILASDLPSTREVVSHGENAYLVPPADASALAQALRTLHGDAALRARLGQAAAQRALEFTWQARAAQILQAARQT